MKRQSIMFTGPHQTEIVEEEVGRPGEGEALVKTLCSAISPGTEMLIYRGEFPPEMAVDETISALAGRFEYPLKYGYAAVGQVIEVGSGVNPDWEGKLVFSFHPHESYFAAGVRELMRVPHGIEAEQAALLPNMETAVNFMLDGQPLIGERVAVFGQGIVGLLTTALLARYPLGRLITADRFPMRRAASLRLGAQESLDAGETDMAEKMRAALSEDRSSDGADLTYEISGSPAALDQVIAVTGFDGRIVIGSWYGQKRASLDLGGRFHRSRIRLISSQVSTLTPALSGRWSKARRLDAAWEMLKSIPTGPLITQRFPISEAGAAYRLLDESPERVIQVVLTY